jgi:hypothetical protein
VFVTEDDLPRNQKKEHEKRGDASKRGPVLKQQQSKETCGGDEADDKRQITKWWTMSGSYSGSGM